MSYFCLNVHARSAYFKISWIVSSIIEFSAQIYQNKWTVYAVHDYILSIDKIIIVTEAWLFKWYNIIIVYSVIMTIDLVRFHIVYMVSFLYQAIRQRWGFLSLNIVGLYIILHAFLACRSGKTHNILFLILWPQEWMKL